LYKYNNNNTELFLEQSELRLYSRVQMVLECLVPVSKDSLAPSWDYC